MPTTYTLQIVEAIDFCNLMISLHTLPIRVFDMEMAPTGLYNDYIITLNLPIFGNRARYFAQDNIEALVETAEVPSDPDEQFAVIKKPCRVYDGNVTFWTDLKFYLYFCIEQDRTLLNMEEEKCLIKVSKNEKKLDVANDLLPTIASQEKVSKDTKQAVDSLAEWTVNNIKQNHDWNEISKWYNSKDTQSDGFNMIVARDINFGIGADNHLAWDIPRDSQHFKELTKGKKLIMGRNTYNSIIARNGKPLGGRDHYVMTTTKHFEYNFTNADGTTNTVRTVSPREVKNLKNKQNYFVIGGAKTYKTLLPYISTIYETLIFDYYRDCDTFLDDNYLDGFKEVDREHDCSRDRETDTEVQLIFSVHNRKANT